jgi:predicted nuclease of predicted toxin-antitoxin system
MYILVDQNISFRLLPLVRTVFPGISHVKELGLTNFNDFQIFKYARLHNFLAVLTLDEDFYNIQLQHGVPPKVIWLRTGNCSTSRIADVLLHNAELIHNFLSDEQHDCLEVFG